MAIRVVAWEMGILDVNIGPGTIRIGHRLKPLLGIGTVTRLDCWTSRSEGYARVGADHAPTDATSV